MAKELTYEIEEIYGFLNDDETKVYARVSWNGKEAKDEIRRCWYDGDELKLGKGIALDDDEIEELHKLKKKSHKDAVDFGKIFESTKGVSERRAQGYKTVDGFMVLRRTDGTSVGH